jgi:hypothetical protein
MSTTVLLEEGNAPQPQPIAFLKVEPESWCGNCSSRWGAAVGVL